MVEGKQNFFTFQPIVLDFSFTTPIDVYFMRAKIHIFYFLKIPVWRKNSD